MARIPPIKRLSLEDFKDQGSWIGRLLSPLNEFMQYTTQALNKQLSWTDNINGEIKALDVTINGTSRDFPIYYKMSTSTVKALWVGGIQDTSSTPAIITQAVTVQWSLTGSGQVRIDNISGLTTGKKYRITLVSIAN